MKLLTVSPLLLAMMALITAAGEGCTDTKFPSCPPGWTQYCNRCFYYVSQPMIWGDAQRNCQSMKANLASVHSPEEYQVIQKVISDASKASDRTWIGGTDGQQEGYWFWMDGTPLTYANWCPGEPNNSYGKESCMEMNFSGNKCMNDEGCSSKFPSVCVGRI
ncbi:ladderlectin-like isoform X1 [Archocentrus centrarchus]|uniref:ladderlectin-like isoform X1 n=1 Tax=Archocentrus centrarchus TaxID=63155 RepID=UPI0011EA3305|nr:ladderlectin-like isoform X1 [Archocentrus centrarchus]